MPSLFIVNGDGVVAYEMTGRKISADDLRVERQGDLHDEDVIRCIEPADAVSALYDGLDAAAAVVALVIVGLWEAISYGDLACVGILDFNE